MSDPYMFLVTIVFGVAIGLVLGMLGGGGSILTVPALVYPLHMDPHVAVTASLMIVGVNALMGSVIHWRSGHVRLKEATLFGVYGIVSSYAGARLSTLLDSTLLMILFALLMLVIAVVMLRPKIGVTTRSTHRSWWLVLLGGLGVGLLTGFLGVGGGFLVVPALVLLLGMEMPTAVGSSLIVIAMNSAAGIVGHLNSHLALPWAEILVFTAVGIGGLLIGAKLMKILPVARLQQAFALFVLGLSLVLLVINVPKLPIV
ncbi:MAG TPA: sulfite exporter TauE/SafE family protein [Ktedonobacteraceae bacterium]|nr:sulfite exporter TauE/SafE family protein [Ktedonobacteraceae bacterium]